MFDITIATKEQLEKLSKKELIDSILKFQKESHGFRVRVGVNNITYDLIENKFDNFKQELDNLKINASKIFKYNEECDRFNEINFDYEVLDNTSKNKFSEKFDPFNPPENILDKINENLKLQQKYKENQLIFNKGYNKVLTHLAINVPQRIYKKHISKVEKR